MKLSCWATSKRIRKSAWRRSSEAIRRVYASTFSRHAKAYVRATPYRLEEEKMAVILQQVVGTRHGAAFLSGFFGSGALAQLLSRAADDIRGWHRGRRSWAWDGRWWMAGSA